jgi:2-polyprenyl-3-methyl-5-hydroxy-6-metoxy-1,4-benzoquinol methylase
LRLVILKKGNFSVNIDANKNWIEAQVFEKNWWSTCQNTVWEEIKQLNIAPLMGLKVVPNAYTNYRIPLNGQSILDIGGGPSSLLLKCENYGESTVADPCDYPKWVEQRYKEAGIHYSKVKGEDILPGKMYDEVWIYNCLLHVENPLKIIRNAQKVGKIIRLFEWVDTKVVPGHPQTFTEKQLNEWLKGEGKVHNLNSNGNYGTGYAGVFLGDSY